jgi:hypothetical protein
MKVVEFLRNDMLGGVAYSIGEIAGFDDVVADKLMNPNRPGGAFAKLHGDGKPKAAGGRIPNAKDWFDQPALNDHVAKLRKAGEWPAEVDKPVVIGAPKIMPMANYTS